MNTIYDENEKKHSQMIKNLKELPQIKAPENFDYNLMTRIRNKNFSSFEEERKHFSWGKFLAPSAIVVTAIILFFIFLPPSQEINNSILVQPQRVDSQSIVGSSNVIKKENANLSQRSNSPAAPASEAAIPKTRTRLPINNPRAISLDDYISGGNINQKEIERGNVVKSGNEPAEFDEFFVTEKPDQKTLEKYRAKIDSIKKAQMRADSLKRMRKMP
ncbi:MAG: hypothetical protein AB1298_03225 [Bacteroidota bacterium]